MIYYHYTSGNGIFGIINSEELHCTNVRFLNDPSEQSYFDFILQKVFTEFPECKTIYSALYNLSYQNSVLGPYDKYIVSFSKNQDSLSMWNYYSKGNGYNLGIDIGKIRKRYRNSNITIHEVEMLYDEPEQIKNLKNYILGFKDSMNKYNDLYNKITHAKDDNYSLQFESEQIEIMVDFNDGLINRIYMFKNQAYKNEEEVRLIISRNFQDDLDRNFKVSPQGVFLDYISLKLKPTDDIKSVSIHPLNGHLHIQGTINFLASKVKNNSIEVLASKVPFRLV